MAQKRIGELLVEAGAITPARLHAALEVQAQTRQRLGAVLVQREFITEEQLVEALAVPLGVPAVDLKKVQPEWRAVHMLRVSFCEANDLFPYAVSTEGTRKLLLVAMADPLNTLAIQEVEFTTGLTVSVRLCTLSAVRAALLRYYHRVAPAQALSRGRSQAGELMARPAPVRPAGGATGRKGQALISGDEPLGGSEPTSEATVVVGEEILSPDTELPEGEVELLAREREKAAMQRKGTGSSVGKDLAFLYGQKDDERIEQKFWALVRILARKGLITKEEFRTELDENDR